MILDSPGCSHLDPALGKDIDPASSAAPSAEQEAAFIVVGRNTDLMLAVRTGSHPRV